jgi:hypothetical protein
LAALNICISVLLNMRICLQITHVMRPNGLND